MKNQTYYPLVLAIILASCKSQDQFVSPEKLNYDGEERQLLLKGITIQYLPSERFGIKSSNKKLKLIAVKIDNETNEEIILRQPLLQIKKGNGTEIHLVNPTVRLDWEKGSGRDFVFYSLRDFKLTYRREEIESKKLMPIPTAVTNGLEESLILGAADLALRKRNLKKYKKPFYSAIFQKAIPPKTSVYGFIPIEDNDQSRLIFGYNSSAEEANAK
jgi:hypothetical protein